MLDNRDKAFIMRMIAEAKQELRCENWDASNRNHADKQGMKEGTEAAQSIIDYNTMIGVLADPSMEENNDDTI